jgi:hypothetical protein
MNAVKQCAKCQQTLPLDCFERKTSFFETGAGVAGAGYWRWCKQCYADEVKRVNDEFAKNHPDFANYVDPQGQLDL